MTTWQDKQHAKFYTASERGYELVQLDEAATKAIVEAHRGRKNKQALYLLLTPGGGLREDGRAYSTNDYKKALSLALREELYIYNARSKKCFRPIWYPQIPVDKRTADNMCFESVRCTLQNAVLALENYADGRKVAVTAKFLEGQ
jgi:hypothetical protein